MASDANTYHVTLKEETVAELEELYAGALDSTEAIRMAVDDAMHRRRSDRGQ